MLKGSGRGAEEWSAVWLFGTGRGFGRLGCECGWYEMKGGWGDRGVFMRYLKGKSELG